MICPKLLITIHFHGFLYLYESTWYIKNLGAHNSNIYMRREGRWVFSFCSWKLDIETLRNLLIVFHQDNSRIKTSHTCLFITPGLEFLLILSLSLFLISSITGRDKVHLYYFPHSRCPEQSHAKLWYECSRFTLNLKFYPWFYFYVLGWPKISFVFFCKMALVVLSCL